MPTTRVCRRCSSSKTSDDFYTADNTCKECRKEGVRTNRAANVEYYRAYDKQRQKDPGRRAACLGYSQRTRATPEGKAARLEYQRKYRAKRPHLVAVHLRTERAVRAGLIAKGPCVKCGSLDVLAHHEDYSKWNEVTWMCVLCHTRHHAVKRMAVASA